MSNPWTPASTNKTGNYQLNQWVLEDKPRMSDFNYDNYQVDEALAQLKQQANGLSAEQAATAGGLAQLTQDFTQHNVDPNAHANLIPKGGEITLVTATCTYSSGVFTLTGLPVTLPDIFTVRFKAPVDFTEGDTLSINALPYALFMPSQQPAQAGAFAQNAVVSLNVDLVTGKAFLAGGGGSVGEWEEVTDYAITPPSYISPSLKIRVNRSSKLLYMYCDIYQSKDTDVDTAALITNSIFTGNVINVGIGYASCYKNNNRTNAMTGTCKIGLNNGAINISALRFLYPDNTGFVSNGYRHGFVVTGVWNIPAENWL